MKVCRDYSRGFLSAASAYRRMAKDSGHFDDRALREQWEYETHGGEKPDPQHNGFTLGKWRVDVHIAAMRDDYMAGLFCKAELLDGSCAMVRKVIMTWPPVTFFAYRR